MNKCFMFASPFKIGTEILKETFSVTVSGKPSWFLTVLVFCEPIKV